MAHVQVTGSQIPTEGPRRRKVRYVLDRRMVEREARRRMSKVRALCSVPGVDAVYLSADRGVVYVVTREHGDVSWERLLEIEQGLPNGMQVTVRAHQGRDPREMFPGLRLVC